ncbi:uncharacterized protein G2W53_030529 [Senna tora]|uniref:Uncharacterized protein n=1 Tax=Senna tora TaxID=362788 RepID=A0A834WAV3_9FABA|nr:uncharacterized protein G2W53_030529 [Senna tora]
MGRRHVDTRERCMDFERGHTRGIRTE